MSKIKAILYAIFTTLVMFSANRIIALEEVYTRESYISAPIVELGKFWVNYEAGFTYPAFFMAIAMCFFFCKSQSYVADMSKAQHRAASVGAVIYALCIIVGRSFMYVGDFGLIIANKLQAVISFFDYVGYFIFIRQLLCVFFVWLDRLTWEEMPDTESLNPKYCARGIGRIMLCLFICYSPYVLFFFPGGVWTDVSMQLMMYTGEYAWTTHHPIFTTWIAGKVFDFGCYIGDCNIAVFLFNIAQTAVGVWTLAYAIQYFWYRTGNKRIRDILLIIFATALNWPLLFYSMSKDSAYDIAVLWFVIFLMKIMDKKDEMRRRDWLYFGIVMLFVNLTRNNGIYLLVGSIVILVLMAKHSRWLILGVTVVTLLVSSVSTNMAQGALQVGDGSIREALSIPFQQTARYVCTYELTDAEYKELSLYADVDGMKTAYIPEFSDNVKWLFREKWSKDDLKG